jgi:class 3 adenylate cyclase
VLIVTSRSRQIQELIEYLRLRYHLLVVSTAPDAIQAVRTQHPILVIIDTQRIDGLNALDLIKTLQRQQPQFKSCYLGFTQKPLRPEIALEFFDVGSKEILDVTHSLQLVLNRIDFWFDWQKQVKSMTRRNQELYSQNLFQRSELARYGELQHFLPKNVAQEVMAGIYNVDSHRLRRQTVTILFADIVGFTLLSSQLSPELLAELLNEYLQQMTQVVVNHGGIVDKFIGDEVMALFGAPEEQPETIQVQNAFSAALSMVDVVQILQKKWQKRLALDLNIRVGINTGECTAGVFGSDSLRSYTVIGSPVNLAARLISVAPPGGIVCCENSLKWVKTRTRFIAIGEFSLKGIENLVEVYQIHSVLEPDQIQ